MWGVDAAFVELLWPVDCYLCTCVSMVAHGPADATATSSSLASLTSTNGYINYSNTTKNNRLFYRRFGFTSEAFVRTDFRCRSSVCKSLSHAYWRPAPEVSADEGYRREAETSIKQYIIFGCIRVINVVFVSTWWNFSQDIQNGLTFLSKSDCMSPSSVKYAYCMYVIE